MEFIKKANDNNDNKEDTEQIIEDSLNDFKIIENLSMIPHNILFDDFEFSDLFLILVRYIYSHINSDFMINIYEALDTFNINTLIDHSLNDNDQHTNFSNHNNDDEQLKLMYKIIKFKNLNYVSLSSKDRAKNIHIDNNISLNERVSA